MARPGTFTAVVVTVAELNALGRVYTSGTRPTGADLYEGLEIFETDTNRRYLYAGAAWRFMNYGTTANRPGVILTDAAQSITSATTTDITWGTEVFDFDGWTSGASATLTVPAAWAGRYMVTYSGVWSAGAGALSGCNALINGVVAYGTASSGWGQTVVSFTRALAASDTLKFQVYQNSGGAIDVVSRCEVAWLGI